MKTKSLIAVLAIAATMAFSADVKIGWQPPEDAERHTNITYRVYANTEPVTTNSVVALSAGTNTTATLLDIPSGTWYFWVTAIGDYNLESAPSPVTSANIIGSPKSLIIESAPTLTNKFSEIFRIRIE